MRTVVCARLTDESSAVGALLTEVVTAGSKPPGTKIQRGNSLVVPWTMGKGGKAGCSDYWHRPGCCTRRRGFFIEYSSS